MAQVVEGYSTDDQFGADSGAESFVGSLRSQARRELIRRLTLERVRNGGLQDGPRPSLGHKLVQIGEAVAIGVVVCVLSNLVVQRLNRRKGS